MEKRRILVALKDETPQDRKDIRLVESTLKEHNYDVFLTSSGFSAIQEMRQQYPLLMVNIDMPGIGGLELLQTAKSFDPDAQVLIVSPEELLKEVLETLRLGAFDYILTPILDVAEIMNKVTNAWSTRNLIMVNKQLVQDLKIKNEQLEKAKQEIELWNQELENRVKQRTVELEQLFRSTVKAIMRAMEAKDPYTHGHSARVTQYSAAIGRELGLKGEDLGRLTLAAELHDIGKIAIKDKILLHPGKLSEEDLAIMRTHPVRGAEIIEPIKMLDYVLPGVRWHHEWVDGTGYPDGLKGDEIPLQARIIGIADTFDAMTATRAYQRGMDPDWVVEKIKGWANSRYDPEIVNAFVKAYEAGRIRVIEADDSLVETYDGGEIPVVGPPPKNNANDMNQEPEASSPSDETSFAFQRETENTTV